MPKKGSFEPYGEFAKKITSYFVLKAKEAVEIGVNASEGDYSWKVFKKENPALVEAIADKHPGGESDRYRLVRDNHWKQLKRFKDWLSEGRGMILACLPIVNVFQITNIISF